MNKSKIEWCDMSWNPVTGCLNNCEYCYAHKITKRFSNWEFCVGERKKEDLLHDLTEKYNKFGHNEPYPFGFEPTFHKYRLDEPQKIKKPQNIFVCSMADLFGDWVPDEWIAEVFKACKSAPQHNYLFLTKNPVRYRFITVPKQSSIWLGTTINKNADLGTRGYNLFVAMQGMSDKVKSFLSIEPLQQSLDGKGTFSVEISHLCHFHWIIIGAETGNRKGKITPKKEWIDEIATVCDKSQIPVFMKDSLIPVVGEANMRREMPEGLKK